MPRFRLRKPFWLMLLMAAAIVMGWLAFIRYQANVIDCATGAESCQETHP